MLPKQNKNSRRGQQTFSRLPFPSFFKKAFYIGVAVEVASLIGFMFAFRYIHKNHEKRMRLAENAFASKYLLENYYWVVDDLAGLNIREQDSAALALREKAWKENDS